ncbi:hypothetical protein M089_3648 [Bacteroides ovatus str. 3725 D9 iii]|nr:hypothetical protein M089_3648 [Bacteroides ovatus str. 3725 D9 iii]
MLLHFRKSLYFYDHLYNYAICNITFGGGDIGWMIIEKSTQHKLK